MNSTHHYQKSFKFRVNFYALESCIDSLLLSAKTQHKDSLYAMLWELGSNILEMAYVRQTKMAIH
ncbi:hypothetical protein [Helicobacter fennelliae]|uniref:Uncharacterized protein n=1 Tax=Helicobacter fennelliae MRY12-0050 TaxID=1325130 RepID=T1DW45_9HELI|nr:hypothetical protein [Helicobacter fennelliae]GAD19288.1 hypothetical protein HFN_0419 [Helicobacter fennelliae MRY12-0050]